MAIVAEGRGGVSLVLWERRTTARGVYIRSEEGKWTGRRIDSLRKKKANYTTEIIENFEESFVRWEGGARSATPLPMLNMDLVQAEQEAFMAYRTWK